MFRRVNSFFYFADHKVGFLTYRDNTLLEALEGGPAPTLFVAVTVNV
jgi:hypothetical protein